MSGPVELTPEVLGTGLSMAVAIIDWQSWSHRKVESLRLMEGTRGRRRVSVDCTPLVINWPSKEGPNSRMLPVPLTLMKKDTLRDLDVADDQGRSIPVLGTEENAQLASAALAAMVEFDFGREIAKTHWETIQTITRDSPDKAMCKAIELANELSFDTLTRLVFEDLAENFLLVGLLPKAAAGCRQVLKYSYHWELNTPAAASGFKRFAWIGAGLGLTAYAMEVALKSVNTTQSYHLECEAPSGLMCTRVEMPANARGNVEPDSMRTAVGHAKAHYDVEKRTNVDPRAILSFAIEPDGVLARTCVISAFVAAFFLLIAAWNNSFSLLDNASDAATSLLLFLPALFIALNVRGVENIFVSRLLRPLRFVSGTLAVLLVAAGLGLVLQMSESVTYLFWWVAFGISALAFSLTLAGYVVQKVGGRS